MAFVFRLLHPDEYNTYINGISAKDPYSTTSVFQHVVYGSGGTRSRYISTCGSLDAVLDFRSKSKTPNGPIIRINITTLPPGIEKIDLRSEINRMPYIENTPDVDAIPRFHRFTNHFQEVLLHAVVGFIPAGCIELVQF